MAEIDSADALRQWLAGRDAHDAVVIASRTAARVIPLLDDAPSKFLNTSLEVLTGASLRCAALAQVAAKYPTRANELYARAAYAADAARAARAAYAADAAGAAARAVYAADKHLIWGAISVDIALIAAGRVVIDTELWPDKQRPFEKRWLSLKERLDRRKGLPGFLGGGAGNWQVWFDWYEAVLDGRSTGTEDLDFARARIPDEVWKQGPKAANAAILNLHQKFNWPSKIDAPAPLPDADLRWDFFVSYSSPNEADAKDISTVLEGADFATFAQFKDILPGNDFVAEMQRGLADSGRVVALYSKAYWESGHCKAEWNAAYAADPQGEKRKLIPFLLEPVTLPPLAKQRVYRSLVGLTGDARRDSILAAVRGIPKVRNRAEVKEDFGRLASPQVTVDQKRKLNAVGNPVTDVPFVDEDITQLPMIQREIAKALSDMLPDNASRARKILKSYGDHLLERGAQPFVSLLDTFASALQAEIEDLEKEGPLSAGVKKLLADFQAKHSLFRTHFPLANEQAYAETPLREDLATSDALKVPVQRVAQKTKSAADAGLATNDLANVFRAASELAGDLGSLPPPSQFDAVSMVVTVKRRYVLNTIGTLVSLVKAAESDAKIMATPEGRALRDQADASINDLMKLVVTRDD